MCTLQETQSAVIRQNDCPQSSTDSEMDQDEQSEIDVSTPGLPRRKRAPWRFEVGETAPEYPDAVQDHYWRIYFETIDLLIAAIQERFQQRGYLILGNHPNWKKSWDRDSTGNLWHNLHQDRLKAQLTALHCSDTERSLDDLQSIVSYLKVLNEVEKEYYSEVIKVAKLVLVMPATNALSECSFCALCRLKT